MFGLGGALRHPLFLVTDAPFSGYISMHIITTTHPHIVKVVPRQFPTGHVQFSITNEETKEVVNSFVSSSVVDIRDNFIESQIGTMPSGFINEGTFYTLIVQDVNDSYKEVYRGKMFCTDQTDLDKYTTIENTYTEKESSSNGYLYR